MVTWALRMMGCPDGVSPLLLTICSGCGAGAMGTGPMVAAAMGTGPLVAGVIVAG